MIQLIQNSILTNTPFLSQMKATLVTEHFDKLQFHTEDDIRHFGRVLELSILKQFSQLPEKSQAIHEKEYTEKHALLSSQLQFSIQTLLEYIQEPENYINANYVRVNQDFTLSDEQIALDDNALTAITEQSFKQDLANFMLERASHYQKLNAAECLQLINHSTRLQHKAQNTQTRIAEAEAPTPFERRSTEYDGHLMERLGGEQRYDSLIERLNNDKPFFQEVIDVGGHIESKVRDEDGYDWIINITENDGLLVQVFINNKITITNPEGVQTTFHEKTLSSQFNLKSSCIPTGAYPPSLATIQDILTCQIKSSLNYCLLHGHLIANNFNDNLIQVLMGSMVRSGDCPERSNFIQLVEQFKAQMPLLQLEAYLTNIFSTINQHGFGSISRLFSDENDGLLHSSSHDEADINSEHPDSPVVLAEHAEDSLEDADVAANESQPAVTHGYNLRRRSSPHISESQPSIRHVSKRR